jgi:hypothetical protein
MPKRKPQEDFDDEDQSVPELPVPETIQDKLDRTQQENTYFRNQNMGLNSAVESNFNPRPDANVVEYKLSSEDLLERIEHYLRGDVLKRRMNADNQEETYYSVPTRKISVNLYKDNTSGRVYVVDHHPSGGAIKNEEWQIVCLFEKDELGNFNEVSLEDNYKDIILDELKQGLASKAKKPKISSLGLATKEIPDNSKMNLSEEGVSEVMNILSMYITKETFLSWYKEERIYEIMGDIGDQLNKFFLINFKRLGLDSEYKKTKYPMIVVNILHSIENAYRRAIQGQENRGTREGILVTQHQGVGQSAYQSPMPMSKKKWSPWDRTTW